MLYCPKSELHMSFLYQRERKRKTLIKQFSLCGSRRYENVFCTTETKIIFIIFSGGSTALVTLFIFDRVYVANAGDCRACLFDPDFTNLLPMVRFKSRTLIIFEMCFPKKFPWDFLESLLLPSWEAKSMCDFVVLDARG